MLLPRYRGRFCHLLRNLGLRRAAVVGGLALGLVERAVNARADRVFTAAVGVRFARVASVDLAHHLPADALGRRAFSDVAGLVVARLVGLGDGELALAALAALGVLGAGIRRARHRAVGLAGSACRVAAALPGTATVAVPADRRVVTLAGRGVAIPRAAELGPGSRLAVREAAHLATAGGGDGTAEVLAAVVALPRARRAGLVAPAGTAGVILQGITLTPFLAAFLPFADAVAVLLVAFEHAVVVRADDVVILVADTQWSVPTAVALAAAALLAALAASALGGLGDLLRGLTGCAGQERANESAPAADAEEQTSQTVELVGVHKRTFLLVSRFGLSVMCWAQHTTCVPTCQPESHDL